MRSGVTVAAPPSKSLSHRKILTASLAEGESDLRNVLESADTERTLDILSLAGAVITRKEKGVFAITGTGGTLRSGGQTPLSCYLRESGTSARLLAAALAAGSGEFYLHGSARLHARPMSDLFAILERLGAVVTFAGTKGCLPATIRANGLTAKDDAFIPVSCDVSSQFLSGLLLAAPLTANGLRLLLAGEKTVSWPYVGLTLQAMEDAGRFVTVQTLSDGVWNTVDWRRLQSAKPHATRFSVSPGGGYKALTGRAGYVEGDYSGASYLLAAGAVGPGPVTVTGLSPRSLQGDAAVLDILKAMGAGVAWDDDAVTVTPGKLTGIRRDMGHCPDLVPAIAVLAALAEGETVITGVAHLAAKESDRLAAPAAELAKIGCGVDVSPDGLTIRPALRKNPGGVIPFSAHNDHRMAMSLALLERAGFSAVLDDPACVAKSFPEFWDVWKTIHPGTSIGSGAGVGAA